MFRFSRLAVLKACTTATAMEEFFAVQDFCRFTIYESDAIRHSSLKSTPADRVSADA
jgi:hypothetical protein